MNNNKLLRFFKALFALLSPFAIIAIIIYLIFFNTTYINLVRINGNAVDNSYNNAAVNPYNAWCSNLARIDDKIYYNYANNDPFKYGTYEISNNFTKRIYWEGISTSPYLLNLDVVGDDKILLNKNGGKVEYFDVSDGTYKPFTELKSGIVKERKNASVFYIDGKQYWYCGDEHLGIMTSYEIYTCENDTLKLCFSTDEISEKYAGMPAFDGDYIYFTTCKEESAIIEYYMYKYNTKNNSVEKRMQIPNTGKYIIACNDKAYSIVYGNSDNKNDCLVVTDINAKTQKEIFDADGSIIVNGYDDLICIGVYEDSDKDKNGLYVIDVQTDQLRKIYSGKEVISVHILDDKWIYFSDRTEKLYRITPDGKTLEKVFG